MKTWLRGASGVALLTAIFGVTPAWAQENQTVQAGAAAPAPQVPASEVQQTPQAASAPAAERVVVTGQLISGASEDAPAPVEVFDLEDLKVQGAPTAAEFLRSLNISSEAAGNQDGGLAGTASGFANVNLRGLGSGRTMVLLNGRRFQSSDAATGADINTLPMMAVGRIDILKDGASVTYGAGAVGGVINYITRRDVDGLEIEANYKGYDKSAGEFDISGLWGKSFDAGNFLFGASYGKQHPLRVSERDFAVRSFKELPGAWVATSSNPGDYFAINPTTGAGTAYKDYTPAQCRAAGGELYNVLNTASTSTECALWPTPAYNLVEEETYFRGYFETNYDLTDSMEFHAEVAYAKTDAPYAHTASIANGAKRATETRGLSGAAGSTTSGYFTVPYSQNLYNANGAVIGTTVNPFAQEFYNRVSPGTAVGSRYDLGTSIAWRPLMASGNPLFDNGRRYEYTQRERWGGTMQLKGDITKEGIIGRFIPEEMEMSYDFAVNYSRYTTTQSRNDYSMARLQNALRGYGGADCKAVDRVATVIPRTPLQSEYPTTAAYNAALLAARRAYDQSVGIQSDTAPGTNGCQYFNPFASSFQTSIFTGAANTAYGGAAYENSAALVRWITMDRITEAPSEAMTFDATFTGKIPWFELPGGNIGWAAGTQWRQTESRLIPIGSSEEVALNSMRCVWGDVGLPPTFTGQEACAAISGPFYGSGIGRQIPTNSDRQVMSYYAEAQIPVLDNLNFQVAVRREEYKTVTGDIYKIAGKYDVTDWLAFRASYSTNFAAPPDSINNIEPQASGSYISSLLRTVPTTVYTVPGITPEDDTGSNFGVIFAPQVAGGQLRASVDFWEFTVLGEVGTTALGTGVFSSVFGTASPTNTTFANCNAQLAGFVTWDTGSCVDTVGAPNRTTAANISNIRQYQLNTGGFITNGLDIQADYTHDVGPGTLTAAISATNVLIYKVKGYSVPDPNGGAAIPLVGSFDGLGSTNFGRGGTVMPEWRGNASLRYSMGDHNFSLRANYVQGVQDDIALVKVGAGLDGIVQAACTNLTTCATANSDDEFATYGWYPENYTDFDFTYLYTPSWVEGMEFRLSVLNITDENPMPAQNANSGGLNSSAPSRVGYHNGFGNPRGRQISVGLTKKF